MSNTTVWHATKPDYFKRIIDGFIITECKRHKGGWLCKLDGNFKFHLYGKFKFLKAKKKEGESKTATPLTEVAVLQPNKKI